MSADFADLARAIARAEDGGADALHLDVMDGHFVPNISFGPALVAAVRRRTKLPLDVHLMVEHPRPFLEAFRRAGGDTLVVHLECRDPLRPTLEAIRALGARAGLAVKPDSPMTEAYSYLDGIEELMVMGVRPGFSGQSLLPGTLEKLEAARQELDRLDRGVELALDGGVTVEIARRAAQAGATFLVCGQSVFGQGGIVENLQALRSAITVEGSDAVR